MEFCRLCAVQKKPPLIPILSSNLNVNEKILRLLQIKVKHNLFFRILVYCCLKFKFSLRFQLGESII